VDEKLICLSLSREDFLSEKENIASIDSGQEIVASAYEKRFWFHGS